jgi:hypothetical protein
MFDSRLLYVAQALLIGTTVYILVWRQHRILRLQVIGWTSAVIAIAWRYGTEAQLGFYSNDQYQYAATVRILLYQDWEPGEQASFFWWTEFSKIPYPGAALPLAATGIHIALALKTVSLACLLALSRELLERYDSIRMSDQIKVLYLTGCGLIGSFFSILALRETMMMYFVYRFATDRTLAGRLMSITIVFLLRAHLAAALVVAEIGMALWTALTRRQKTGFMDVPVLVIGGTTLGFLLFSWRFNSMQGYGILRRLQTPFNSDFGINETLQTASNFAGLQFLTSHEAFIRLSISELLLLRTIFSDTVLIPLGFTTVCIFLGYRLAERHKFVLLAFAVYVSIVTNTDFNSFRQNIPLMPLMGMVLLDFLKDRKMQRSSAPEDVSRASDPSRRAVNNSVSNVAN